MVQKSALLFRHHQFAIYHELLIQNPYYHLVDQVVASFVQFLVKAQTQFHTQTVQAISNDKI